MPRQAARERVGVVDVAADYRTRVAAERGYAIYASDPARRPEMEQAGIPVAGTMDDLAGLVDVVVDCTPKGIGARNKELYERAGLKAIFQGGESHDLTGLSFTAQVNYAEALDRQFARVGPLRTLFKDEVGQGGPGLGLPEGIVWRPPFPGPGLAIRIIGEVTMERLDLLRLADAIAREELSAAGLDREIWQCPVVLLADVRSVGVQGDGRTYGHPVVLRPVSSEDAMTADWSRVPYDVLARISTRITNEVPGINRVVLDVTSKPPGTIEWE